LPNKVRDSEKDELANDRDGFFHEFRHRGGEGKGDGRWGRSEFDHGKSGRKKGEEAQNKTLAQLTRKADINGRKNERKNFAKLREGGNRSRGERHMGSKQVSGRSERIV